MLDNLDIYNESDDSQRGDDDDDEDDELVKKIKRDPEYLQTMNYLMFVNGP